MSNDGHKPRRSGSKNDGNKEKTPKVHETKIASKEVAEKIYKDQVKRVVETNKIKLRNGRKDIESPVYTPNLTEIESSLKEKLDVYKNKLEEDSQNLLGYFSPLINCHTPL